MVKEAWLLPPPATMIKEAWWGNGWVATAASAGGGGGDTPVLLCACTCMCLCCCCVWMYMHIVRAALHSCSGVVCLGAVVVVVGSVFSHPHAGNGVPFDELGDDVRSAHIRDYLYSTAYLALIAITPL